MKVIRLATICIMFTALFAVAAIAQTGPTKIAVINTFDFQTREGNPGITKYVAALKRVDDQIKPLETELETMATKINNLKKEIETLQKSAANSTVPVSNNTVTNKIEEYNNLGREYKFKEENAKARLQSLQNSVMGPVLSDIAKAMQEYATKNGLTMILDAAKLDQAGLILAFDRKFDVTDDFIKFYNARPAGTATK